MRWSQDMNKRHRRQIEGSKIEAISLYATGGRKISTQVDYLLAAPPL